MFVKKFEEANTCTVGMSDELYKACIPQPGPRGPLWVPGWKGRKMSPQDLAKEMMLQSGKYAMHAGIKDFICIPLEQYEFVLRRLEEAERCE